MLRQSWERWRWIVVHDVRIILVDNIFAIPASRGLCFLCVIVARLKNQWIFSASVAWNQIQAANRDQRKYPQKRNKHPFVFRGVKPKWLSAKPCSFFVSKELFNNECKFFKSLCVKPTICHSTTTKRPGFYILKEFFKAFFFKLISLRLFSIPPCLNEILYG